MPNGRSGGFLISRKMLRNLLQGMERTLVCGSAPERGRTPLSVWREVTVEEIRSLCDEDGPQELWVEEQEHSWYIIHFSERSRSRSQ
jgi:hypothetical protein